MRIVFSVGLLGAILLSSPTIAVRLGQGASDDDSLNNTENLAQTEQAGQSMPTINIINNNRNMTGVASSGGGGGCMGGGGGGGMGGMAGMGASM